MKKPIIVLYHDDCLDGFCALWVAWKKFGTRAAYYAVRPCQLPRDISSLRNAEVFVLDSSLTKKDIAVLHARGCRVTILDHHKSSEKNVPYADASLFDIYHSGAMLAWNHFFPHTKSPWLVKYVEDGDLWSFKLAHTDQVRNVLVLLGFHLKKWNLFARALENPNSRRRIIKQGEVIEQYRKTLIEQSVQNAYLVTFGGHTVYAVNEATEAIRSEVAHALYTKRPPFSVVWSQEQDLFHISLRSNGTFDVSKLAQKYGGGGHAVASGFLLSAHESFPWRVVKQPKKGV